jgi:hypothetical protein
MGDGFLEQQVTASLGCRDGDIQVQGCGLATITASGLSAKAI